jgi:hypothetical protein
MPRTSKFKFPETSSNDPYNHWPFFNQFQHFDLGKSVNFFLSRNILQASWKLSQWLMWTILSWCVKRLVDGSEMILDFLGGCAATVSACCCLAVVLINPTVSDQDPLGRSVILLLVGNETKMLVTTFARTRFLPLQLDFRLSAKKYAEWNRQLNKNNCSNLYRLQFPTIPFDGKKTFYDINLMKQFLFNPFDGNKTFNSIMSLLWL